VYARIRPLSTSEVKNGDSIAFSVDGKPTTDTLVHRKDGEPIRTRFDHAFGPTTTQQQLFDHIGKEVVDSLASGYNASVFAYGQTGSGKTHTMEGDLSRPEGYGLTPRLIDTMFKRLKEDPNVTGLIARISYVQIYQERIQDLLNDRRQLDIHMDRAGHYIAQGANWVEVTTMPEAMKLYFEASRLRATNATEMNLVSSRSHAIMMVHIQWDEPQLPGLQAQLNLIDLAGSEKLYQSGATGEVMKEAIAINKSLSALGNVVSKLVDAAKYPDRRTHIPFKDSKLTYLLQSSLGGANLVHFILAMSASSAYQTESLATVEFGKRALQLILRPVRNPIDYKRLEEMEMMIEKMRNHIKNLEEELKNRPEGQAAEEPKDPKAFLHIHQLHQEDEVRPPVVKKKRTAQGSMALKAKTELSRIVNNLPETMEDLTSHCILFPDSKKTFRELGGLVKLVQYIERSPSVFYKAHAAHTIAYVCDDEGKAVLGDMNCVQAVSKLLQMKEERCKEAACVALEALVRHAPNKKHVEKEALAALADLINGYGNQQVQEAACSALAAIVDGEPTIKTTIRAMKISEKLAQAILNSPPEVTNVIKAATTCIGRLAHGDPYYQGEVARLGGIEMIVDKVLFSSVGERDHQLPILASYALVNLCCSNSANLSKLQRHSRYEEIRFKLTEGLARAFGTNSMREGFGKATAQETQSAFPYYGVTLLNKWTAITSGGRPIFSTFAENPQFYLYVNHDCKVTLLIQDAEYESRMQKKVRRNTVYMGLAIFKGEPDLVANGLKQLDFHGRMVEIAKFTSNCENVLNCSLPKSETPYIVVPFTSQLGRTTTFALSTFADQPVDLVPVPETSGWDRGVFEGSWTPLTGRAGESFDWRNNPQLRVTVAEKTRVVCVMSYVALDDQRVERARTSDESCDVEEKPNTRTRLHVRLFNNTFANDMRYIRSVVPMPQDSTYIAGNNFSSNSYVTLSAVLEPNTSYVVVPFTEEPCSERWRVCVYSDTEDVKVEPLTKAMEWHTHAITGQWKGEVAKVRVSLKGRLCMFAISESVFLRYSVLRASDNTKIASNASYWFQEATLEHNAPKTQDLIITLDGVVRRGSQQQSSANTGSFTIVFYYDDPSAVFKAGFDTLPNDPSAVKSLVNVKSVLSRDEYGYCVPEADVKRVEIADDGTPVEANTPSDGEGEADEEVLEQLNVAREANEKLARTLKEKDELIKTMQQQALQPPISAAEPETPTTQPLRRSSSTSSKPPMVTGTPTASGRRPSLGAAVVTPGAPSPAVFSALAKDITTQIDQFCSVEKVPSATQWQSIRKEMREIQMKLRKFK
jgi:hypothetical protein